MERLIGCIKKESTFTGPFTELGGICPETGEWRTARAKAFPPALCRAIARSVLYFSDQVKVVSDDAAATSEFLATFPPAMGPDYWG